MNIINNNPIDTQLLLKLGNTPNEEKFDCIEI